MRYLICLLLGICMFASCIDDESKVGDNVVSTLSFVDSLESNYTSKQNTTFVLPAPEVMQANSEKPLSYEWQMNYKVVSTSKNFEFECDTCGDFPCRLKISNEDGAIFQEFKLKVPFAYERGVAVLSRYDNRSMLSFRNEIEGEKFVKDVYRLNNAFELGKEPRSILYSSSVTSKYFYIVTENPIRIVKLEPNTMSLLNVIDYPEPRVERVYKKGDFDLCFVGGGRTVDMVIRDESFNNKFQQSLTGSSGSPAGFPGAVLSNTMIYTNVSSTFYLAYDIHSKSLLRRDANGTTKICKEIDGLSFVNMLLVRTKKDVIILVKNDLNEMFVVNHNVPNDNFGSKVAVPSSAGMTDKGVFLLSNEEDVLFYSNGNKIYRYNYTSQGNFPTSSDYTVGEEGDVIKEMLLDPKEEKLYVAVDAKAGDYRGCVYCYDNETKQLLWKERGVAGEIVQMIYRQN